MAYNNAHMGNVERLVAEEHPAIMALISDYEAGKKIDGILMVETDDGTKPLKLGTVPAAVVAYIEENYTQKKKQPTKRRSKKDGE